MPGSIETVTNCTHGVCCRAHHRLNGEVGSYYEKDKVDSDGGGRGKRQTALHFAAQAGHAQCITTLLSAGANADARDFQHHTARELAALESHELALKAFDIHAAGDAEDFQPRLQQLSESGKGTMVPKKGGRAQARREGRSYGAPTLADAAMGSSMSMRSIRAGASR